jgi:hypothetical protein
VSSFKTNVLSSPLWLLATDNSRQQRHQERGEEQLFDSAQIVGLTRCTGSAPVSVNANTLEISRFPDWA